MMKPKKTNLLTVLKELLTANAVRTQEDIKHALQQLGFEVNQSKISRFLHKLGAVKTKNEAGEIVYQLPKESPLPSRANLANLITDIVNNEIIIIIHTSPGSASLIARLLDSNQQKLSILGTVAGDDTIVVIPQSIHKIEQTLTAIKTFINNLA